MAITSETSSIQYSGNNSTETAYTVDFPFFETEHLRVIVTDADGNETQLANGTDFAVTGTSITTTLPWDGTHRVTIYREVPVKQTTSYQEGGAFPAASHERALDLLTMIVQQVTRRVARSLAVSEADEALGMMPVKPMTVMGFDLAGQPRTYTAAELVNFLNLYFPGITEMYMQSFANAGERAIATPGYAGQLATQRDEGSLWIATGTSAGSWQLFDITPDAGSITASMLENPLNLASKTLTLPSAMLEPVGTVIWYAKPSPPAKYLKCNGAAISRATYSELFAVIATNFGSGNGSTTFNLPDLRGEFIRGWDDGRGVDSGRSWASGQSHQFQEHVHTVSRYVSTPEVGNGSGGPSNVWNGFGSVSTTNPTNGNSGAETRPRNMALLACIKYEV
jgi:microcystin-dependent protein